MADEYLNIAPSSSFVVGISPQNKYYDSEGQLRIFNIRDPLCVTLPLPNTANLSWKGVKEIPREEPIPHISAIHTGLIISPEAQQIFEQRGVPNVQYIPLTLFDDGGGEVEYAWYVHVFNWRDPFDLENSTVDYWDWPEKLDGSLAVSAALGDRLIGNLRNIEVNQDVIKEDVFLARITQVATWQNVFFSKEFAAILREKLEGCRFGRFYLDGKGMRGRDLSKGTEV